MSSKIVSLNSILPDLAFLYDPMGQRIAKIVKDRTGGTPSDRSHWRTTWYVRDASGNVMSTYEEETEENSEAECPAGTYDYTTTIAWTEAHIYGSSRVGMETQSAVTSRYGVNYDSNDLPTYAASNCISYAATAVYSQKYGDKRFELSNHLGNVLVVVSDLLIANTGTTLSYSSEVISATDYYPYGMVMDERHFVSEGLEYRFGFQNQEEDNELWSGAVSYKYRVEDPRLGRFFSVDPLASKYPHNSVYAFSENRVIDKIELEGLECANPDWERKQNANAFGSLQEQKTQLSSERYEFLLESLTDAWYCYTSFALVDRELSARGISRYLGGEGGYDIYSYSSIEEASFNKFQRSNERLQNAVVRILKQDISNYSPGTYRLDISHYIQVGQEGALAHDFGTAFGSFRIEATGKFNVTIDENGNYNFSGVIYYTFGDNYRWHIERGTEASHVADIADHVQMEALKDVGANQFGVRCYYNQSCWGNQNETYESEYEDCHEEQCPIIEGYYALPEGAELKYDFTNK